MSIRAEIISRVYEGRLVQFTQAIRRLPDQREIYLPPDIKETITNPNVDRRFGRAQAMLEAFVRGDVFVVRLPPKKNVTAMMALLDPMEDDVWEFRIREPKPGLRIFGRFAEKDIFIGTHCYVRDELPKDKWAHQIKLCRHEWKLLFPAYPALSGSNVHDFISNARLPP